MFLTKNDFDFQTGIHRRREEKYESKWEERLR